MPLFDMNQENFLYHPKWDVFTFGNPPVCIDIMVKVLGLEFENCYTIAQEFEDDGLKVKTIHINNLITAKKMSNRPKDIDDINNLLKK